MVGLDQLSGSRRDSDLEFHQLLEKLPVAAYTCDAEGLITYFNPRAVQLWGRAPRLNDPADRFCGSFKLFSPDGLPIAHHCCWMARALEDDTDYNGQEIVIQRPDGSRVTTLAHANPIHDRSGALAGAVNVLLDITERKQAEELLREGDRRQSEFLAVLAHELRNPLAPLRNGLQILRLAGHDPATLDEARLMMERQLGHMVRLIDDLLDLSRITNGKVDLRRERIDLAAPLRDAVEISRPLIEEGARVLSVTLPPQPVYVDADRTRLSQVFANLLHNAVKYTHPGGHIHLTLERHGSDAVVEVRDDGIGIPPAIMPGIFAMFSQAERCRGGLGIGLSLARELVQMHGGRVEAQSGGRNQGSQFVVRLPVVLSTAGSDAGSQGDPYCSKYRILVVDDNRDAALSLSLMLKIQGHETQTAYDGLEAVQLAEMFRPDVILLDIGLPTINGHEACRRIRQQAWGETIVLIALTGWGQEEDKCRSKEAGFNFHMVKPMDPAALERLLAGLLLTPA